MPLDAWIVVGVLGLMMVLSWIIMIGKGRSYARQSRANEQFMQCVPRSVGAPLDHLARDGKLAQR